MTKKTKNISLALCSLTFIGASALGACGGDGGGKAPTVQFCDTKTVYYVGSNVDLTEIIVEEKGVEYAFSITYENTETDVEGETFYAKQAGTYTVSCTPVKKGKKGKAAFKDIVVYDNAPIVASSNATMDIDYDTFVEVSDFETFFVKGVSVISDTAHKKVLKYFDYYENEYATTPVRYYFGVPAQEGTGYTVGNAEVDWNFDGEFLYLGREGIIQVYLDVQNDGGGSEAMYKVEIREETSAYTDLTKTKNLQISFNKSSQQLTWDAVENAAKYRVKIGYANIVTDALSYNVGTEYVEKYYDAANGFFNFDLAVIPLDADGEPLRDSKDNKCKLELKNVVIAPEKFGNCVISKGTHIDHASGLASLQGGETTSLGIAGINAYDNSYVAWTTDEGGEAFGLNDYVDIEFKGNNLPTMLLFADKVNGNMACGSSSTLDEDKMNKGIVVLNGLYGAYSGTMCRVAAGDTVTIFGPNRIQSGWSNPNNRYCPQKDSAGKFYAYPQYLSTNKIYPYPLLTQEGLTLTPDVNYKYTIGSFERNGKIMLDIRLYDMDHYGNNIYNIHYNTGIGVDELKPGAIVAYCPLKDGGANAEFKVSKPYESEPDLTFSGVSFNQDGTVTIDGFLPANVSTGTHTPTDKIDQKSGYVAYKNAGIGDYIELEFTGNNMPYMTFLADNLTPNLAGGKGYTVINGIISQQGLKVQAGEVDGVTNPEFYTDRLRLFGPYRYGKSGEYDHNKPMQTFIMNATDPTKDLETPAVFSQNNLQANHTYRVVAGLYRNQKSICLELILIDKTDGDKVLCDVSLELGLESDLKAIFGESLTGNIILHGAMKGLDEGNAPLKTTIKRSQTTVKRADIAGLPASPRYTLAGNTPANGNTGTLYLDGQQPKYMAWEGDYGVGTYIQFTFTGKNMPNVLLFADAINGNITDKVKTEDGTVVTSAQYGYLLLNQMKTELPAMAHSYEYFAVWGPNRLNQNGDELHHAAVATSYSKNSNANHNADLAAFQLNALNDTHTYRYTVGTKLVEGIVVIDMKLEDLTATQTFTATVSTGKTEAKLAEALGKETATGHIVAYAALKGGEATSFMVTDPYTVTNG